MAGRRRTRLVGTPLSSKPPGAVCDHREMQLEEEVDIPLLDAEGRVHGCAGVCKTGFAVWDDLLRLYRLDELRSLAQTASWPLAASSFWLPMGASPQCALEELAAAIFALHVPGGAASVDPSCSGAEWWANVSDSDAVCRPDEHGGYGKIAMHFDKDEAIYASAGLFVHPLLATVTYLTNEGAPTVVVPNCTISTEGDYHMRGGGNQCRHVLEPSMENDSNSTVDAPMSLYDTVCLVPPRVGRHVRFDGRWLHGAPEMLCVTDAESYQRITFLVNIWVGHKPGRCLRFRSPWAASPTKSLGAPVSGERDAAAERGFLLFRLRQRSANSGSFARKTTVRLQRGAHMGGGHASVMQNTLR